MGIEIAYTPSGVLLALIFIGLPFVVRTVQPVLADLEKDVEEAAAGLGASRWQTFLKVILPHVIAQVELARLDGELIEVTIAREVLSTLGLREGDQVSLRPRTIRAFQNDRLAA